MKRWILLADDDKDDQQLLAEALQMTDPGFTLHSVSSARDTLDYLHTHIDALPDLIILDYNMPDQNGAEVLDMIRSNQHLKNIPIVVWSTSVAAVYKKLCADKGASAYFQKPNSFPELLEITREMLHFASR